MKTPTKVIVGSASVLVVILVAKGLLGGPSDQEQIQTALDDAILASKEGRAGPVMDFVSRSFEVNGEQLGVQRSEIAKYIKQAQPNIEILNRKAEIQGNTAVLMTPVKAQFKVAMFTLPELDLRAKITFTKESARSWLVIPTSKWRVTKVEADGLPGTNP